MPKRTLLIIVTLAILLFACKPNSKATLVNPSQPEESETRYNPVLVVRHPNNWLPKPSDFIVLREAAFSGEFAYLNEDTASFHDDSETELNFLNQIGRIVSYGYEWLDTDCSSAKKHLIHGGATYVIVYKDSRGAEAGFAHINQDNRQETAYTSDQIANVGEKARLFFYEYESCSTTAQEKEIIFYRNNIIGIASIYTHSNGGDQTIHDAIVNLSNQIDSAILQEAQNYPGDQADLINLSKTATTIEPTKATEQAPTVTGNPKDYLDGSMECVFGANTYDVVGYLTNNSPRAINVIITWGASYSRYTEEVVIAREETESIYLLGPDVVYDPLNQAYSCSMTISAEWE